MKFLLLFLSLLACGTGTKLWSKCTSIANQNYCVDLNELAPCDLEFEITSPVWARRTLPIDVGNPTSCFTAGGCDVCLSISNITTNGALSNGCIDFSESCSGTSTQLDCFSAQSTFGQCLSPECPNACSGNGLCGANGVCQCSIGWSGHDCSQLQLAYEQCVPVQNYGDVCLHLSFQDCSIATTLSLNSIPVYSQSTTAPLFQSYFTSATCVKPVGCSVCLSWANFVANETYVRACPIFNMSCLGAPLADYHLDCFEDDNLVPDCFENCPRDCSGHGQCFDFGVCTCIDGYQGPTCMEPKCNKVSECSGRGTCVAPNQCKCGDKYFGSDCSSTQDSNDDDAGKSHTALIVGVIFGVVAVFLVGGLVFYLYKRGAFPFSSSRTSSGHMLLNEDLDGEER